MIEVAIVLFIFSIILGVTGGSILYKNRTSEEISQIEETADNKNDKIDSSIDDSNQKNDNFLEEGKDHSSATEEVKPTPTVNPEEIIPSTSSEILKDSEVQILIGRLQGLEMTREDFHSTCSGDDEPNEYYGILYKEEKLLASSLPDKLKTYLITHQNYPGELLWQETDYCIREVSIEDFSKVWGIFLEKKIQ